MSADELRLACERLFMLHLRLRESNRQLSDERAELAEATQACDALTKQVSFDRANSAMCKFKEKTAIAEEEVHMLRRLVAEEASSLSLLEKALSSEERFCARNFELLSSWQQRSRNEQLRLSKLMAKNENASAALARSKSELQGLEKRLSTQIKLLQTKEEEVVHQYDEAQRLRREAAFSSRVRADESLNIDRLRQWKSQLKVEHDALLQLANGCGADCSQPAMSEKPRDSNPTSHLKLENLATLQTVVASVRRLDEQYRL